MPQGFDANGNLTSRGAEQLGWDHRNRLIAVQEAGKPNWSSRYDYNNRICERTVGLTVTAMIYDDMGRLLAELNADGSYERLYAYDAVGVFGHINKSANGTAQFHSYLFDGLGSVVMVTDEIGQIEDTFQYGPWGEAREGNAAGNTTHFGFTGRWGGYTDGRINWVLDWNRWYGPAPGRWTSRDLIGILGGNNLYSYVQNISTSWLDPFGAAPISALDVLKLLKENNQSNLPDTLFLCISAHETGGTFDNSLINTSVTKKRPKPTNATGLFQVLKGGAKFSGYKHEEMLDPVKNIKAATRQMQFFYFESNSQAHPSKGNLRQSLWRMGFHSDIEYQKVVDCTECLSTVKDLSESQSIKSCTCKAQ